jgi:transposase InsO family protein
MESKLPWQDKRPDSEQVRFIERWLAGRETVSRLCEEFGISRKTGHKRINRFKEHGWGGTGDLPRTPRTSPLRTPDETAELIVQARLAHPTWGPKKIVAWLEEKDRGLRLPAASTAGGILKREGLVRPRKRVRASSPGWAGGTAQAEAAGRVWCADLKGWFKTGDGVRCDPFTLTDAASRYLFSCRAVSEPWHAGVRKAMEQAFREHGLPEVVRTDNGPPFASTGLGGLSRLSVWWVKLGIIPERIEPGRPEQNGRHERMHRTLKAETASPPEASLRAQQRAFDRFRDEYNTERPHEALNQKTPASAHRPSPRPYPSRVASPEYSGDAQVRMVRQNGEIKWQGETVFLTTVLSGEPVGLVQGDEHLWSIMFGPLNIGLLDSTAKRVFKTAVKVLPMSPV